MEEYPDDIDLVLGEEEAAAADADIEESGLETRPEQNKQSLSAITPLETTRITLYFRYAGVQTDLAHQ